MIINRTVVLNSIEPAPLSLRCAMGLGLDLRLAMRQPNGAITDPTSLHMQLVLLPRSRGGQFATDVNPFDVPNGVARAVVESSALVDTAGYGLELYVRTNEDPPVPTSMIAQGVVRLQGTAFGMGSSLQPITVPTVIGPPGPPGPAGHRGSIWFTGPNPPTPGTEPPLYDGDMFLQDNGDVYRWDGTVWVLMS